jgi:hypothetical protein
VCPTTLGAGSTTVSASSTRVVGNYIVTGGSEVTSLASDLSNTAQCSGHGVCKTMREMGEEFNGMYV